jgi:hypothetical protein
MIWKGRHCREDEKKKAEVIKIGIWYKDEGVHKKIR